MKAMQSSANAYLRELESLNGPPNHPGFLTTIECCTVTITKGLSRIENYLALQIFLVSSMILNILGLWQSM